MLSQCYSEEWPRSQQQSVLFHGDTHFWPSGYPD
ncbi:hypothetical protein PC116_g9796 [Phytophthora cactorum]|uniref:Uncharacterized protein n=1 Tax=Phytophthora cactorum TaxID=29920 RepID=A0A8T1DTK7_9STRA|nr:hypothetical protein PC117_g9271 [Phytophthora cactorum]KAG3157294.1 hypothetical protein C6341_g14785 [Phytophthora cactorum]KAG3205775.1 hypothetical protein PC128_g1257 [Phytophthora cactorum]KAG4242289.1 hypothetical protein PC116_g9796 [Phytophthora cactorum]